MRVFAIALSLLVCCTSAAAAPLVRIAFAGDVSFLNDPQSQLDGSVAIGSRVTGEYIVDLAPSPMLPSFLSSARLTYRFGNYVFDETQERHSIFLDNDLAPGYDLWHTRSFRPESASLGIPQGPAGIGFSSGLQAFDLTATALDGTEPTFVLTDLEGWTSARLYLNGLESLPGGGGQIGGLIFEAQLDTWQLVPEPSTAALLATGLAAIALRRRAAATAWNACRPNTREAQAGGAVFLLRSEPHGLRRPPILRASCPCSASRISRSRSAETRCSRTPAFRSKPASACA